LNFPRFSRVVRSIITCKNGLRPLLDWDKSFKTVCSMWLRTVRIISLVDQGLIFKNRLNALGDFV